MSLVMCMIYFFLQGGLRPPEPLTDEIYDSVFGFLDGKIVPKRSRSKTEATAARKIRRHKYKLSTVFDPVCGELQHCIIFQQRILPRASKVVEIVKHFSHQSKGDGHASWKRP